MSHAFDLRAAALLALLAATPCLAQDDKPDPDAGAPGASADEGEKPPAEEKKGAEGEKKSEGGRRKIDLKAAGARAVELLLGMQEGEDKAEWPYEGVYRVQGEIPIGYRVGGTSIVSLALLTAPGYAEDAARKDAVARALTFVLESREHPLMSPDYDGGYDVRGWGFTYALLFLLRLEQQQLVPAGQEAAVADGAAWYLAAIQKTEIPQAGGWSYSRPRGNKPSDPCPFMTGPTLLALYQAKAQGKAVDAAVVQRALAYLEKARTSTGGVNYSGVVGEREDPVPGAVGRMLATETALVLAGRSSLGNLRAALDAFIVHWRWLEERRAKTGTHVGPYGVAPYYFYYAHHAAAQAVELLPRHERAEYRRRVLELLFATQREDGSWNDRVFPRTANFGTAMSLLAIHAPQAPALAKWSE